MTTEWSLLCGYEDEYLICREGTIKSIAKTRINEGKRHCVPERIITPRIDKRSGYPVVKLTKGDKYGTKYLHRLLAQTFIANPYNKSCINHLNGIKTDYSIENLEWCTYSENTKHAIITGLSKLPVPKRKKVIDICTGVEYDSIKEAAEALHVNAKTCNHYLHGRLANPTCLRFVA